MWPDLAKFGHFGYILNSLAINYVRAYLVLGKNLNLLWSTFYTIGQIFIAANGLILTNNLTILSHCHRSRSCAVLVVHINETIHLLNWLNGSSPLVRYVSRKRKTDFLLWLKSCSYRQTRCKFSTDCFQANAIFCFGEMDTYINRDR